MNSGMLKAKKVSQFGYFQQTQKMSRGLRGIRLRDEAEKGCSENTRTEQET